MSLDLWLIARVKVGAQKHGRITLDDKVTMFQQLATLVASGTPLMQSIRICAKQSDSRKLQWVLEDVAATLSAGSSLREAMANHPRVFEPHWLGVIHSGEISGSLPTVLQDLNEQTSEYRQTRRKVIGALIYPITLIVIAVAAVAVMLWLVVPTFANMFEEMGAELPGITKLVIQLSDAIIAYGVYVLIAIALLVAGLRRALRSEAGMRYLSAAGMAAPVCGSLMVHSAMYRFAAHSSLLLRSGVGMLEALEALESVFHRNPIYREALRTVQRRVASGRTLADALEQSGLFTGLLVNMVRTGEESGQLATVLDQIAPYYREKTESAVTKATKLMEPAIIVVMGTTIAAVMMSIYMPMFELSGKVH